MKKNKLFFFVRLFLAFYLHISKILLSFAENKQTYWIMTLLDILDPDVTLIVGNMLSDGWTLKRVLLSVVISVLVTAVCSTLTTVRVTTM